MQQVSLADLFVAYFSCRQNKRRTVNALDFELDYETKLIKLYNDIKKRKYEIGKSIAFIVFEPVKREVFAANFRDRIVHHYIIDKINQYFEKEFIEDSYSCRTGKGTLYGARRIFEKIRECSKDYTKDCYILKLDIRSFFMSIDKNILFNSIRDFLSQKYTGKDKETILYLIEKVIFNNPEDNCVIKGKISDWNGLPYYKSLFWSDKNKGMPIGNLTSQVFANFYLNFLDKYVTEDLGIKYYGRYVDDFVIIHEDKEFLKQAHIKIADFLRKELKLTLHPQKVYLQHYSKGVKFIGAYIKPNRIYIGNRTKGGLYKKIYTKLYDMSQDLSRTLEQLPNFEAGINSYFGFMRHYDTYNLRRHVIKKLQNTFVEALIDDKQEYNKLSIDKIFRPVEQKKYQIRAQRQYRRWQQNQIKGENKNGNI